MQIFPDKWKERRAADCFLKVTMLRHLPESRQTPSTTETHQVSVSDEDFPLCCVLFCETWGDGLGSVASLQTFLILLYFLETQYSPISDLAVIFLFISPVFRAVKTLRSVEPCQLLSKLSRLELKTTVKPQQGCLTRRRVEGWCNKLLYCAGACSAEPWLNIKSQQQNQVCCFPPQVSPQRSPAPFKQNNSKQTIVFESKERHKHESNEFCGKTRLNY